MSGALPETVYSWVKKARWAQDLKDREARRRTDQPRQLAAVIALDEMWSYVAARRQEVRIWTAVAQEADGSKWVDFEVGDRSEETFLRLYERLPAAQRYRSDAYAVYDWLPANRHVVGRGGAVNWNDGLHSRWRDKLQRLQPGLSHMDGLAPVIPAKAGIQ